MRWVYGCVYTSKRSFILNHFKLEELDLKTRGGRGGMAWRAGEGREGNLVLKILSGFGSEGALQAGTLGTLVLKSLKMKIQEHLF